MILLLIHKFIDLSLFCVYLSLGMVIFYIYMHRNISQKEQLFPDLWMLASCFCLFRGIQKGFEILISFSLITIEMSIVEIIIKVIILVTLIMILIVIRNNYFNFVNLIELMDKIKQIRKENDVEDHEKH